MLLRSVPSGTKSLLIAACSALIYTPAFEHFGIVPIEAMYLGRPVIAMDAGGPRETLVHQETGFLCPVPSGNISGNPETAAQVAKYMCKWVLSGLILKFHKQCLIGNELTTFNTICKPMSALLFVPTCAIG